MPQPFESKTVLAIVAISLGAFLLGFVFWHLRGTDPVWAITSFVLVYDPDMRSALSAGFWRLGHTLLGTVLAVATISAFGLHKWLMPLSLALAAFVCGTVLHFRNSWRVVLVSVALIVGASLLQPGSGLEIAFMRALEVTAGSLTAIGFSWAAARLSGAGGTAKDR